MEMAHVYWSFAHIKIFVLPERNIIIVMGDFNAKIGSDNRARRRSWGSKV